MEEVDRWLRFAVLIGSIVVSALYGTLCSDIGTLHDAVIRLRAETRCFRRAEAVRRQAAAFGDAEQRLKTAGSGAQDAGRPHCAASSHRAPVET